MSVQELERGYLSTSGQSAENKLSQPLTEIKLAPHVGRNSRLEKTGFNLPLEMFRLFSNYNQNIRKGKTPSEALMLSVSESEINIRTFIIEYIESKTVLPHVSRLGEVDGAVRMVGQNGVPVVSGITSEERSGATREASVKAESFLTEDGTKKAANRVSVINSPVGHSGRINQQGKKINYKVNQTIVSYTGEQGELHSITLVSDLNQDQSRRLSISLGVEESLLEGATEAEQVANIVRNPALFSYGRSIANPVRHVLDQIIAIRGNGDFRLEQDDGTVEVRSVAETRQDIENYGELLKFNPVWEGFIKKLTDLMLAQGYDLNKPFVQHLIAKKTEETILEITVDHLEKTKPELFSIVPDNVIYFNSFSESSRYSTYGIKGVYINESPNMARYAIATQYLETRSGCNSGEESGESISGGSSSESSSGSSWGSSESKKGKCRKCGRSKKDGHYHCPRPNCLAMYANETKVAPENRTKSCSCGFKFACGSSKKEEQQQEDSKVISFPGSTSRELAKAA